jgi:hypothetical protein
MITKQQKKRTHKFDIDLVDDVMDRFDLDSRKVVMTEDDELIINIQCCDWQLRDKIAAALMKKAVPKSFWNYQSGKYVPANKRDSDGRFITELVFSPRKE